MKPNVILVITDQQRKDSLGCYGSAVVRTPYLDRMAQQGIRFERAYCTSSVCTPSRATLYSGRYVSHHGAWNIGTSVSADEVLLSHLFQDSGYRTHHVGKLHFQPFNVGPAKSKESLRWEEIYPQFRGPYYGFEQIEMSLGHSLNGVRGHYGAWVKEQTGQTQFLAHRKAAQSFGGEAYDWEIPLEMHNTFWTVQRAIAFLESMKGAKRPFFLNIGFQDPHHPHALPLAWAKRTQPERMRVPQFTPGELDDKPPHFRDVHEGRWSENHTMHGAFPLAGQSSAGYHYGKVSDEDARMGRAYYYGMVEMIDQAMGDIIAALERLELAEQTIVLFTTDHGELLGDHGIWMKGPFHYEQLINIPLLVRWKGHLPEQVTSDAIVSLVDMVPTLLSLCEIAIPSTMNGYDLSELWYGRTQAIRDHALVECIDDPQKLRLKTIVTERYKLTCYYGEYGKRYGELYDLVSDPHEIQNLWTVESANGIKAQLLLLLLQDLETLEKREERIGYA